ncbi:hypothetical protein GCM10010421_22020 [Streptomyces glaucus]|uniref:Secreted protein n=1 Tax=Streptomyces glaucus TaxID=284029 RepID=A0ABP5WTJ7_9ACTN
MRGSVTTAAPECRARDRARASRRAAASPIRFRRDRGRRDCPAARRRGGEAATCGVPEPPPLLARLPLLGRPRFRLFRGRFRTGCRIRGSSGSGSWSSSSAAAVFSATARGACSLRTPAGRGVRPDREGDAAHRGGERLPWATTAPARKRGSTMEE